MTLSRWADRARAFFQPKRLSQKGGRRSTGGLPALRRAKRASPVGSQGPPTIPKAVCLCRPTETCLGRPHSGATGCSAVSYCRDGKSGAKFERLQSDDFSPLTARWDAKPEPPEADDRKARRSVSGLGFSSRAEHEIGLPLASRLNFATVGRQSIAQRCIGPPSRPGRRSSALLPFSSAANQPLRVCFSRAASRMGSCDGIAAEERSSAGACDAEKLGLRFRSRVALSKRARSTQSVGWLPDRSKA